MITGLKGSQGAEKFTGIEGHVFVDDVVKCEKFQFKTSVIAFSGRNKFNFCLKEELIGGPPCKNGVESRYYKSSVVIGRLHIVHKGIARKFELHIVVRPGRK